MKSKTLISSIIVITIAIALVIMFTSGADQTDLTKTVSTVDDRNTDKMAQNRKETQGNGVSKPVHRHKKASPNPRKVTKSENDSANRLTRVRRPGQKFHMVRVDTTSIQSK